MRALVNFDGDRNGNVKRREYDDYINEWQLFE